MSDNKIHFAFAQWNWVATGVQIIVSFVVMVYFWEIMALVDLSKIRWMFSSEASEFVDITKAGDRAAIVKIGNQIFWTWRMLTVIELGVSTVWILGIASKPWNQRWRQKNWERDFSHNSDEKSPDKSGTKGSRREKIIENMKKIWLLFSCIRCKDIFFLIGVGWFFSSLLLASSVFLS